MQNAHRLSSARGVRAPGGGRNDKFAAYKQMLKDWVEVERSNGHGLDYTDLMLQFEWTLLETLKGLEPKLSELAPPEKVHYRDLQNRVGTTAKLLQGSCRSSATYGY